MLFDKFNLLWCNSHRENVFQTQTVANVVMFNTQHRENMNFSLFISLKLFELMEIPMVWSEYYERNELSKVSCLPGAMKYVGSSAVEVLQFGYYSGAQ